MSLDAKTSEDRKWMTFETMLHSYDGGETWCECQKTMPCEGVSLIKYFDKAKTATCYISQKYSGLQWCEDFNVDQPERISNICPELTVYGHC